MTAADAARLRALAGQYAEIAHGEPMRQRREKWILHNSLRTQTFPFHIEDNGSFLADRMPARQCADPGARRLEDRLLRALTAYALIDDDRVIPDRFLVDWTTVTRSNCEELEITRADNGLGSTLGYRTNHPIRDIDADWGKLQQRTSRLDRDATERQADLARTAFAGLLRVDVGRVETAYSTGITHRAVHLMGMENLYVQMADRPEAVHRLLGFLAEDNLALGQWEEEQGLLTLNHDGNQGTCSGSCFATDETARAAGSRVAASDRWGFLESQESAGISGEMFDAFLMPHLTRLAARFKLLKFGCCEAVHPLMACLRRLPNLRKVSVTPWCDIRQLAESCPHNVIWCRKPVPLLLCGDAFRPETLRAHLQETLDAGRGFFIEFVFRDTNRLSGAMADRIAATCAMVRALTGRPDGSRG